MIPCEMCNSETEIVTNQMHHYVESGLENIYLEGIEMRVCNSCGGKTARIPRIIELHNTIGQAIALKDSPLTGKEVKFLRKRLGYNLREWAIMLRVVETTLSKWENGEREIGTQSDLLIRLLYVPIYAERAGKLLDEPVTKRLRLIKAGGSANKLIINVAKPIAYRFAA